MTNYDPSIIQKLADKLYRLANQIVASCTIIGVLVGGFGGYLLGKERDGQMYAIIGAIIVGLIGFAIGLSRSFHLRVMAQLSLCMKEIEANTKRS